jgi:hypothetical protein
MARSGAYLFLAAFGAATFVPTAAAQVVTSIQPAWVDTYYRVGSSAPAVGGRKLKVSSKYVTLIQFQLTGIPTNTVVENAILRVIPVSLSGWSQVSASAVLSPWDQETVTGKNPPTIAATPESIAYVDIRGRPVDFDVTNLVQHWVTSPGENFGVALQSVMGTVVFAADAFIGAGAELIISIPAGGG